MSWGSKVETLWSEHEDLKVTTGSGFNTVELGKQLETTNKQLHEEQGPTEHYKMTTWGGLKKERMKTLGSDALRQAIDKKTAQQTPY